MGTTLSWGASSKKDDEILKKIFSLANQNCSNAHVFGDPPKINQSEDSVIDVLDKFRLDPDCTLSRVVKIVS